MFLSRGLVDLDYRDPYYSFPSIPVRALDSTYSTEEIITNVIGNFDSDPLGARSRYLGNLLVELNEYVFIDSSRDTVL